MCSNCAPQDADILLPLLPVILTNFEEIIPGMFENGQGARKLKHKYPAKAPTKKKIKLTAVDQPKIDGST